MRPARVYLICQPTVKKNGKLPDLSPLEAFGAVSVIVPPGMKPSRVPDMTTKAIARTLDDFDPAIDFLAWAGGDTLAAILVGALLEMQRVKRGAAITQFKFLRYERVRLPGGSWTDEGATYHPILITL